MRKVFGALLALIAAGTSARAQQAAVTGPCAAPDSVVVRGNQRITAALIRGDAGFIPGQALNYREIQRAIKDLYATGQFEDVAIACEPTANKHAVIAIAVRERPLLADVSVTGPDRVSASSVRERVDLLNGRPVDPAQVARAVTRIDSLYQANGYYLAQINVDTTMTSDGQAKLVFRIAEGHRLAVSGVQVDGNTKVGDRSVVSAMQTKPEGFFWWQKGEFDENKFASDVTEKIPEMYGKHGFIDAQVVRDTLLVDRSRGKALVDVGVKEGPQYQVGTFEVNGAKVFNSEDIAKFYPFGQKPRGIKETFKSVVKKVKGEENVFDESAWKDATQKVQTAYANQGYIYASVRPVVERVKSGPDSTPTVNLRWEIDERTPAIVNRVEIQGNDITVDNCIRDQILIVPGDVFSQDLLVRSYQSIANLGFFETPLPAPDTRQANEGGDVDVVFKVKEKHTGNVNFGASLGEGYGVGGFIGFDQPNLFGLCKRGSLQWQFGRYINDFNLSYTDPRILQSQISGTVTAYNTRSQYIIADIGRTTRRGGQLRFGFPVPRSRWTRLFVDYGGESVTYGNSGLVGSIPCGNGGGTSNCFRSSLGLTLDRDTRLDMPFPSMGVHQSIETSFTGGPLGGSAAFQRVTGEMRSYTTLTSWGGDQPGSSPVKLVFGLSTRVGALFGNPGPFFVSQQFSLGGVQYGEMLRGYPEFSITPFGYNPNAGTYQATRQSFGSAFFTNTAELGLRLNQQMYVDAFYDAGNLWAKPQDFNPSRLYRGAGIGGSVVTPLGPLGVDVGYGFDRVDAFGHKAPAWQVHFKFGQFFQ